MVYEFQLFKRSRSDRHRTWNLVERMAFDADDNHSARQLAPTLQIPIFEDGYKAVVVTAEGVRIWKIDT